MSEALLLIATDGLKAGASYRFVGPGALAEVEVQVVDGAIENGEGQLRLGPERDATLAVAAGLSCGIEVRARTRAVEFELPATARPFLGALMFETTVDGRSWRPADNLCNPPPVGQSWHGRGKHLLYSVCSRDEGSAPPAVKPIAPDASHQVLMTASLPGTDVTIGSKPASFKLTCPQPPAPRFATDTSRCSVAARPPVHHGPAAKFCATSAGVRARL